MNYRLPINTIKEQIEAKLQHNFGLTLENATDDQCYKAVVLVVRDLMVKGTSNLRSVPKRRTPSASITSAWNS